MNGRDELYALIRRLLRDVRLARDVAAYRPHFAGYVATCERRLRNALRVRDYLASQ